MQKNMKNHNLIKIPISPNNQTQTKKTLPFNRALTKINSFTFSFSCFDRSHDLFNLGDSSNDCKVVRGTWFLDLIDCLKNVCNNNIYDLKTS